MFDQQGMWAMNQAHHQDLRDVAANRRLMRQVRSRRPVPLEWLWSIFKRPQTPSGDFSGERRLAGQEFAR
jgi:hypothetical protein